MYTIRYVNNECRDEEKIKGFISKAKSGYLGLSDENVPYVVPLNYVWYKGFIYFHGSNEGRKVDMIKANPNVCFTIGEEYGTLVSTIPAHTGTAFMSVMIFGEIEEVIELEEATEAMQEMLDKYVPGYFNSSLAKSHVDKYRSSLGSKTVVYKIHVTQITAKEKELDPSIQFYQGRNVNHEVEG